ncbi:hypothetical protein ESCO_001914 [Escovopsis weberi]|uniref:Uncharacterized protein n=1 Tax=Escovopsis weberi TaxID=150374 RepID=A0A0M8N7Z2_ESCWE|nr:hypothetical protein ESCO_001914 [Escovopsis weberi]
MPPKAERKRKVLVTGGTEDADQMFAPSPKRAQRGSVSNFFGKIGKDLTVAHATRGSRANLSEAKREISGKASEVIDWIARLEKGAGTSDDGEALAQAVSEITRPVESSGSGSGIYEKARDCIATLERAVAQHEALSKDGHGAQKPAGLRWAQDAKDLAELEGKAMAISLRTLNGSVLAGTHGMDLDLAPPREEGDDIEMMAWEMLAEGRPKGVGDTWGGAMRDVMRALSEVVKLLPKSDGY